MPRWPERTRRQRLFEKVLYLPNGCQLYMGARAGGGYGTLNVNGQVPTHRATYEMFKGPIPAGFEVDHLCRVRACVNPEHLEAVTKAENIRRALEFKNITHCPQGHEYMPGSTYRRSNRAGRGDCKICVLARKKIRDAERRV